MTVALKAGLKVAYLAAMWAGVKAAQSAVPLDSWAPTRAGTSVACWEPRMVEHLVAMRAGTLAAMMAATMAVWSAATWVGKMVAMMVARKAGSWADYWVV